MNTPKKRLLNLDKKTWQIIIISVAAALFIATVIILLKLLLPPKAEDNSRYKNENASVPTKSEQYKNDTGKKPSKGEKLPENPINFDAVKKDYPDAYAWIQLPGIDVIDYPIMQSSPEADDNFYLDHNKNGKKAKEGAIYIQKLNHNDFSDPNTLIYGHNMLNGTMFGQLKKFRNKNFFDENRTIFIYTPGHVLEYEIISAFIYDDRHIINSFEFNNEDERMEFFKTCVNPSSLTKQVLKDATLNADDKIITLSTCTSNNSERYLVVGKLINDTKTK